MGDVSTPANVKIANRDLVLTKLSKGAILSADLVVERGFGYSPAEDRERGEIGMIPVDAAFSPVIKVNYKVDETRVGRLTNYDKLTLEVWTDDAGTQGSINKCFQDVGFLFRATSFTQKG